MEELEKKIKEKINGAEEAKATEKENGKVVEKVK